MRRLPTRRAVLGLGVAGAGVTLLTMSLTWGRVATAGGGAGASPALVLTGREAAPAAFALALAALAGLGVLLLVGGPARRAVGVLLALLGAGIVVAAVRAGADLESLTRSGTAGAGAPLPLVGERAVSVSPVWAVLAALGGVLVSLAGALAVLGGPGWPEPSARYAATGESRTTDPWRALDQGVDPTVDD